MAMIDPICKFALNALEHAASSIQNATDHPAFCFAVAGVAVRVHETTATLENWTLGQFDPSNQPEIELFCDYSGWHLRFAAALAAASQISPLDLDDILAKAGLFGSFNAECNCWDLYDPGRKLGVRLQVTPAACPEWEPTAPLANMLSWVMRGRGRMVLHAASLGINGIGVLMAGPGGSGKSGTTLSGICHGLQSVGDDYCVLSMDKTPIARPFFRSMKQDAAGLTRVGLSGDSVAGPRNWQGKHVFDLRDNFPKSAVDTLKIKAVLLPKITRSKASTLHPASKFEILQALAPSTMLQLGGDRAATFAFCAALSRAVPGFHLHLSQDPGEIARCIKAFIL